MTKAYTVPSIDKYLRDRLMPVEGAIPHISGIEMYGNSIPAGTVGGDLFEYINFQQRTTSTHAFSGLCDYQGSFSNRCLQVHRCAIRSTIMWNG
jgi:hypothetical protein